MDKAAKAGMTDSGRRRMSRAAAAVTLIAGVTAVVGGATLVAQALPSTFESYRSKHYDISTDLPAIVAREAILRSDLMVREYSQRTRSFSRKLNKRLPLILFREQRDYVAAGALQGSAGSFVVDPNGAARLMVLAGAAPSEQTWSTLQHEGFHQFSHAVIGAKLPIWVEEGLAEYFGDGLFTGDDYLTGVVHPNRLRLLRTMLKQGRMRSLREMMDTTHAEWNSALSQTNYMQAWSMVHFLAHARGRYEKAFNAYLIDVSRGQQHRPAWEKHFGGDHKLFEKRWREYWESMPLDQSLEEYQRAMVLTVTSYLARSVSQKQRFASMQEFFDAAAAGRLAANNSDWLPPQLLQERLEFVQAMGAWTYDSRKPTEVRCVREGEPAWIGTFRLGNGRVQSGSVRVTRGR